MATATARRLEMTAATPMSAIASFREYIGRFANARGVRAPRSGDPGEETPHTTLHSEEVHRAQSRARPGANTLPDGVTASQWRAFAGTTRSTETLVNLDHWVELLAAGRETQLAEGEVLPSACVELREVPSFVEGFDESRSELMGGEELALGKALDPSRPAMPRGRVAATRASSILESYTSANALLK